MLTQALAHTHTHRIRVIKQAMKLLPIQKNEKQIIFYERCCGNEVLKVIRLLQPTINAGESIPCSYSIYNYPYTPLCNS